MVWRLPEPWKWIVLAWFVGTFIISALLIIRDFTKGTERQKPTEM